MIDTAMKNDEFFPTGYLARKSSTRKGRKSHLHHRRSSHPRVMAQEYLEERAMLAGDAQVRFEYVDSSQAVVNALTIGESYTLRAYIKDNRATPEGIFSAYLDFDYSSSQITVTGPITHGAELAANPTGSTATPGILDEVGGVDTDQFPGGRNPDNTPTNNPADELFWFSVPFTANTTGSLVFSPNQTETPSNKVLFFNTVSAVQISDIMFVGTTVNVNPVESPKVQIASTTNGNEAGPTNGLFTVTQTIATATPTVVSYTVSGTATSGADFTALTNTITIPANQTSATIPISVLNDSTIEADETVTITLNSITSGDPTVSIDPAASAATLTIFDEDSGVVSIATTTHGNETGPVNGVFTVTQSSVSSTNTVITYAVTGTASSGNDFTALSGSVTIPAGSTTATINVPVINDSIVELQETVTLTLNGITSGDAQIALATAPNNSATLNITDNDSAQVSIAPTRSANEEGPISGQFTVTLTNASSTATVVSYTTNGSAIAGTDYPAPSGSVTIPAGSLTAVIDIPVTNDTLVEATETIIATPGCSNQRQSGHYGELRC